MQLLQHVDKLVNQQLPFFIFSKAGEDKVDLIYQNDSRLITYKPINKPYIVFCSFDSTRIIYIEGDFKETIDWNPSISSPTKNKVHRDDSDRESYKSTVKKAIEECKSKSLSKVVLSRKRTISCQEKVSALVNRLLSIYPNANCYCFHHPKVGTWIGATPEILLSCYNKTIKTVSLAGTAVYNNTLYHEWGDKELKEQQYVTDSIVNGLQRFTHKINTSGPVTVKAGNLIHLQTSIEAQLDNNEDLDFLLRELHPTPAVCGLPKEKAKAFITDNETYHREFYTGFFGIIQQEKGISDYYVNLRCMQVHDKHVDIYVGGGIVAESCPDEEYQETLNKESTMLSLLS